MKLLHRGQLFLLFALLSVLAACRADTPTDSTFEPSRPDDSVYTSEWQNRFFYTPLGLSIYLDAPIYTYEAASEAASDNAVWDAAHQLGRRLMEDLCERDMSDLPNLVRWQNGRREYGITGYRSIDISALARTDSPALTYLRDTLLSGTADMLPRNDHTWVVLYRVRLQGLDGEPSDAVSPELAATVESMFYDDFCIITKEGRRYSMIRSGDIRYTMVPESHPTPSVPPARAYRPDDEASYFYEPLQLPVYSDAVLFSYEAPASRADDVWTAAGQLGHQMLREYCSRRLDDLPMGYKWQMLRGEYQMTAYRDLQITMLRPCSAPADSGSEPYAEALRQLPASDSVWLVAYSALATGDTFTGPAPALGYLPPGLWRSLSWDAQGEYGILVREGTRYTLLRSRDIAWTPSA